MVRKSAEYVGFVGCELDIAIALFFDEAIASVQTSVWELQVRSLFMIGEAIALY